MSEKLLHTIGHSTRPLAELVGMLQSNGVNLLIDVRTVPKSKTNPQFNKEALEQQLEQQHGISYVWMGEKLGGLRKRDKDSDINAGWDNASFRGYADYMQTDAFDAGLQHLMQLASGQPAAIMCAEVVQFRCHRSLISDALLARGWTVKHIITPGKAPAAHKLTSFAVVVQQEQGDAAKIRITYPAYEHDAAKRGSRKKRSSDGGGGGGGGSVKRPARKAAAG